MQPVPHLPIPLGLWSAPTRMDFKCFLFAAFFLVACVAFSSQDELTDVEGKSKSILFKIMFLSPFHHSTFIVSTMFSTKKQQKQLTTTIYRAKKSAFTTFFYFESMLRFFSHSYFDFLLFLFIFKHRHSNKQRTMVNEYSYYHHFFFYVCFILKLYPMKDFIQKKSCLCPVFFCCCCCCFVFMLRCLAFVILLLLCNAMITITYQHVRIKPIAI